MKWVKEGQMAGETEADGATWSVGPIFICFDRRKHTSRVRRTTLATSGDFPADCPWGAATSTKETCRTQKTTGATDDPACRTDPRKSLRGISS